MHYLLDCIYSMTRYIIQARVVFMTLLQLPFTSENAGRVPAGAQPGIC